MKTKLLQLHNFIQRKIYSDSRQYFEQKFYLAFDSISFSNNEIIHWDNKKEFEFFSLQKQYPFIDDLISYRKKTSTLEEYCDISYDILKDYFNRLKKVNILYTDGFFESKQETVANNIVKDKRRDFFRDLKSIFFKIEEKHSIDLENREREEKKVKSEYNLIVVKYKLLDKFKKMPFKYVDYKDRSNKIIIKESGFYKTLTSAIVVKNYFNRITDFEKFLREGKNSQYIKALKKDIDIAKEKDIVLFLDKLQKNKKKN